MQLAPFCAFFLQRDYSFQPITLGGFTMGTHADNSPEIVNSSISPS